MWFVSWAQHIDIQWRRQMCSMYSKPQSGATVADEEISLRRRSRESGGLSSCDTIALSTRAGRREYTCQFSLHLRSPADDWRHGWPSIRHQHPVPLRCGWNPDGTQTGKVVVDFPFNYPECCVASRHWWKHPAPRWKCWQEYCQKSNLSLRSKSHCSVRLATLSIYFHS